MQDTIVVTIEIPFNSRVKYEFDEDTKELYVDRILPSSYVYPANYGFVENTLSEDNDPLDVLVLSDESFIPGSKIKCNFIGVLYTRDGKNKDNLQNDPKIIAVPITKVDAKFSEYKDINDLPTVTKNIIEDFFTNYKNNQQNAVVETMGWDNNIVAYKIYKESIQNFHQ